MAKEQDVTCKIQVENLTRFALTSPKCYVHNGHVYAPPVSIMPGKREEMAGHQTNCAAGSKGTVSWLIRERNRRLVVMWEVDASSKVYNWMAVGFTDAGVTEDPGNQTWYDQMWDKGDGNGLSFVRGEYWHNTNALTFRADDIEVEGNMGTSQHPIVRIIVRPVSDADLFQGKK